MHHKVYLHWQKQGYFAYEDIPPTLKPFPFEPLLVETLRSSNFVFTKIAP